MDPVSPKPGVPEPRGKRAVIILAGVLAAVILLGLVLFWLVLRARPIQTAPTVPAPGETSRSTSSAAAAPGARASGTPEVASGAGGESRADGPRTGSELTQRLQDAWARRFPGNGTYSHGAGEEGYLRWIAGAEGAVGPGPGGARGLARQLAAEVGLGAEAIDDGPSPDPAIARETRVDTPAKVIEHLFQIYQGYEVWGARLVLSTRKPDGAVTTLSSTLKPVDGADLSGTLGVEQAQALALAAFTGREATVTSPRSRPVLFADEAPRELAWVLSVETRKPDITVFEVLVGLSSQSVRRIRESAVH